MEIKSFGLRPNQMPTERRGNLGLFDPSFGDYAGRRLNTSTMKTLFGLWPNLSRAYEIARFGGYSLSLAFDKEAYPQAREDYEEIKNFFVGVEYKRYGDLFLTIHQPDYLGSATAVDHDYVNARLQKSRGNVEPKGYTSKTSYDAFMGNVIKRFPLGVTQQELVHNLAHNIAWMDGDSQIGVEHLAEAIHYRIADEDCTPLERDYIEFGGILIPSRLPEQAVVQDAIEYLQTHTKAF